MRRERLTLLGLGKIGFALPRSEVRALGRTVPSDPDLRGKRDFAVAACKAQSDSQTRLCMQIAQIAPLTEAIVDLVASEGARGLLGSGLF